MTTCRATHFFGLEPHTAEFNPEYGITLIVFAGYEVYAEQFSVELNLKLEFGSRT